MIAIHNINSVLTFIGLLALTSCNSSKKKSEPVWSNLKEVTSLDNLEQTDFVVTLENPISESKNIIYAPAFLYAWDKIKDEIKSSILVSNANSIDFNLLNKSISHQNSLMDNEYSVTTEIINGAITAKAFFNKTLPFETKLQVLDEPINFNTTKVSAFGMYYYDEDVIKLTNILYYKDDNNFILKLEPKDKQHEIILVNGLDKYRTLEDAIKLMNNLIAEGQKEKTDNKLLWKYQIAKEDIFAIPTIKFNIATNYKNIENQVFYTRDNKQHSVELAYQFTGFIFNENGAVVETRVAVTTDSVTSIEPMIKHPKKMIFDKPFLIVIKRIDSINPYFVMRVANAELLTKK